MTITFFSNLASVYALLTVLSVYIQAKPWQYILCFCLLLCKPFYFSYPFPPWNIFVDLLTCLVLLKNPQQKLFLRFYYILSVLFCIVVFYAIASSVSTLISPIFRQSISYEYMIRIIFVVTSTIFKFSCKKPCRRSSYKVLALEMLLKTLILIGYNTLLYWFSDLDTQVFALLILFVMTILGISLYTFHLLSKQQAQNEIFRLKLSQEEEIKRIYKRVIAFEHLYNNFAHIAYRLLQRKDYSTLHEFLEEHIMPILDMNDYKQELAKIKNTLLQEQISLALSNCAILKNVSLRFHVYQKIELDKQSTQAVFNLLSEFFNNAFKSIQKQSDALLVIELNREENACLICVSNSIENTEQNLFQLTQSKKTSSGYGRKLIAKIVHQASHVSHYEQLEQDAFSGQTMFTQKILIITEEIL